MPHLAMGQNDLVVSPYLLISGSTAKIRFNGQGHVWGYLIIQLLTSAVLINCAIVIRWITTTAWHSYSWVQAYDHTVTGREF